MTSQTHVAGGALFTTAGLGAANAAGWVHAPAWALAIGIAWGAIAGDLPDIDHRKARVSRTGVAFGVAGRLLGVPARIVGVFIRGLRVTHRGPTHSLTFLALWAAIAGPLYVAFGGVLLVGLAWARPCRNRGQLPGGVPVRGARSHTGASRSRPLLSGSALAPRSRPGWSGRRSRSLPSSRFSRSLESLRTRGDAINFRARPPASAGGGNSGSGRSASLVALRSQRARRLCTASALAENVTASHDTSRAPSALRGGHRRGADTGSISPTCSTSAISAIVSSPAAIIALQLRACRL